MIPKKIHYCWLSDKPLPKKIQLCIASWSKFMPDYEIILWNFDRFPKGKSSWVDTSYEKEKYAFAADYIRAYALYNEGGIYMDSDVEVLKSFNPLLKLPYFIGKETDSPIEAAVMGTEKGNELFGALLDFYDSTPFIDGSGEMHLTPMPYIMNTLIEKSYSKITIERIEDFIYKKNLICIFPSDYFSPKSYIDGKIYLTKNTFSIHHFAGSWLDKSRKRNVAEKIIGKKFVENLLLLKKHFCHLIEKIHL